MRALKFREDVIIGATKASELLTHADYRIESGGGSLTQDEDPEHAG